MNPIEQRLRASRKQFVTVADLVQAGIGADLSPSTRYLRISKLKGADSAEAWGAMRAGGNIVFTLDSGVDYALHLEKLWAKK